MPSDDPGDYDIGYRKPPVATRFKPGNNANPGGRPRGAKNLASLLRSALDEPAAQAAGEQSSFSRRELIIKGLVERSARADLAATKLLIELLHKIDPNAVTADPIDAAPLGQDAIGLLKERLARLSQAMSRRAPKHRIPKRRSPGSEAVSSEAPRPVALPERS